MKFFKRLLFLLVFLGLAAVVVGVFAMVDDNPIVPGTGPLTAQDLSQAQVFIDNADPRDLEPGTLTAFSVNENDLELLLGYALEQWHGGGAQVQLNNGLAAVTLSAVLPDNPLGDYLNVHLSVSQWGHNLAVEELKIGGLRIPGALADPVMQYAHQRLQAVPEYVAALNAINGYSFAQGRVNIVYQWQPELVEQLSNRGRDMLISAEEQQQLLSHSSNLASITNDPRLPPSVSLAEVLTPAMLFAKVRGGDPVAENRAAILSLAMYVMGVSAPRVLGLPEDSVPPMGKRQLLLSERHDFAQHFLVSAALTVSAGTGIADTIGLLKEMDDSDGGSGFSFTDIGADRTGVRFAEAAIASTNAARTVQDKLSFGIAESQFMAEFRDLPEFLDGDTFRRTYGGVGAPAYNAIVDDIEKRISQTPFFSEVDP